MSLSIILTDWSDYEAYKLGRGETISNFSTEDPWEVSFLMQKITSTYPDIPQKTIEVAVAACGRKISRPRQRRLFVQCVLKELGAL